MLDVTLDSSFRDAGICRRLSACDLDLLAHALSYVSQRKVRQVLLAFLVRFHSLRLGARSQGQDELLVQRAILFRFPVRVTPA